MSEKRFQMRLCKFLRERSAMVFNTVGNAFQRGFPDLYVAHKQWTGWLELKYGDGRLRKTQIQSIRELRRRGVAAFVCRMVEEDDQEWFVLQNETCTWEEEFETIPELWNWLTTPYPNGEK